MLYTNDDDENLCLVVNNKLTNETIRYYAKVCIHMMNFKLMLIMQNKCCRSCKYLNIL